jgi:hypothetical protein
LSANHLLDRGIDHCCIRPATPRLKGKVEKVHRIDEERLIGNRVPQRVLPCIAIYYVRRSKPSARKTAKTAAAAVHTTITNPVWIATAVQTTNRIASE